MKNGINSVLLLRRLVCIVGCFLCVGTLNAGDIVVTYTLDGVSRTLSKWNGWPDKTYIVQSDSGEGALEAGVKTFVITGFNGGGTAAGAYPNIRVDNGFFYEIIIYSAGNEPVFENWQTYSDTYFNTSGEPVAFEMGIFDAEGNLVSSKYYWVEPGEMVDMEFTQDGNFSVGIRESSETDDGWVINDWYMADSVPSVSSDPSESMSFPTVQVAGIYGEGVENPNLPYDSETGSDGQQIIDAIEASITNTNARIDALKDFNLYLDRANDQVRENMLAAVNAKGDSILQAISEIEMPDDEAELLQIIAATSTIHLAVNNLDDAIETVTQDILGVNTSIDLKGDEIVSAVEAMNTSLLGDAGAWIPTIKSMLEDVQDSIGGSSATSLLFNLQNMQSKLDTIQAEMENSGLDTEDLQAISDKVDSASLVLVASLNSGLDAMEGGLTAQLNSVKSAIENIEIDPTIKPAVDEIGTKLEELRAITEAGFNDGDEMLAVVSAIEGLATQILETDTSLEIVEMGVSITGLAESVRDMDFTGALDSQILGHVSDTSEAVSAVGEAVTLGNSSIADAIRETGNGALETKLDAVIANQGYQLERAENIDYSSFFETIISNQESRTTTDYIPKFDEVIASIGSIPSPVDNSGALSSIIANQETQIEQSNEIIKEGGIADTIIGLLTPVDDVEQVMDDLKVMTQEAQEAVNSEMTDFVNGSGTVSASISAGGSVAWPTVTLPALGTLSMDPFLHFPWLSNYAVWIRAALLWAASAAFLVWFWKQLNQSVRDIAHTPVQATSGGGATGGVAIIKQVAISSAFVGVGVSALVFFMTTMRTPVIDVMSLVSGGGDLASGAPSMVSAGLGLVAMFVPMGHILSLFLLGLVVRKLQMTTIFGVMLVFRLFTI